MSERLDLRPHRGAPCIHVDGKPFNGLGFWHMPGEAGVREWQEFARCGVHLFQLDLSIWAQSADGPTPTDAWDAIISTTVAADPAARIWLRIKCDAPDWWIQANPDHAQVHYDQNNGDSFRWRAAYASPLWRGQAAAHLQRLVAHMESRWGDRVWIYNIQAGDCGEWSYSWRPVVSGYAPAQTAAWRDWLRQRYGDDVALCRAWNDATATCAGAEPPPWRSRMRAGGWPPPSQLIDPAAERPLVDWLHFHGVAQAEALAHLAAATRGALRAAGASKLISAFHGYHLFAYDAAYGPSNAGFSDLDPMLRSPDVDLICSPLAYIHRNPGGLYCHHHLATTIRLHGKITYTEDDSFTHRATWTPWRYCCRDAGETNDILRRNLAGALADGGSQWWMDHNGEDWYVDAETEAEIARMRVVSDAALGHDRGSCAEIAFVSNEESFRILRQDPVLNDILWLRQQVEVLRLGAPVDFVRVRDLDLAEVQGDAARWKLVIVAGCLWLDTAERAMLRRVLCRGGRQVVFLHGQGICDGERLDLALASEVCGVTLKAYPHGGACRGETMFGGTRTTWGTDKEVAPLLHADDPQAEALGWLERQYVPCLVRKPQADWTAWWSGVPGLPAELLGRIAAQAGVHRYTTDGSQVMANAGLVAVHPATDGHQELRLPRPRRLRDALHGHDEGTVDCIHFEGRRGETRIWHIA